MWHTHIHKIKHPNIRSNLDPARITYKTLKNESEQKYHQIDLKKPQKIS